MVVAEVHPGREPALRALLAQMNSGPGQADPHNRLLPFGRFESLHFLRFAILADTTHADLAAHGETPPALPTYLSFFGDCDGPGDAQLDEFVRVAQGGDYRCAGRSRQTRRRPACRRPRRQAAAASSSTPSGPA